MNEKKLVFPDLVISNPFGSNVRLQSGRVNNWRSIDQVSIIAGKEDTGCLLEFDKLYIDVTREEAEQIAELLGIEIQPNDD